MNEEYQEEFIKQTNKVNDILEAMNTYLNRNKILIDKLTTLNLSPDYLEEWGEFLMDWGKVLTEFGENNKEREILLQKMFGFKNDS